MSFRAAVIAAVLTFTLVLDSIGPGSSTSAKDRTIRVSESERAACMPDAVKLCRSALPNVYKVLLCFRNHRSKISSSCNAVLASYGL